MIGILAATALIATGVGGAPPGGGYVDIHVHTAGLGGGGSGAFVNQEMLKGLRLWFYLRAFGVTRAELAAGGDAIVIGKISAGVAASRHIDKAVVLALDGIVDAHGELDRQATQVYVPNDFVAGEVARYDNVCFGASVNPYRRDALERLTRARAQGALLVKWIPNIMAINPADDGLRPFYAKLVELGLPLLSHAGQERSFAHAEDAYGDPRHLRLPLSMGVTVIAAHIATTGKSDGEDNFLRILPMFARHPNLYADISSLTQINKLGYLRRALTTPGVATRLLYGTDWPLQFFPLVSPYYHVNHIGFRAARTIAAMDNLWDRDVALKRALGAPGRILERGATLLDMERCK